MPEVQSPPGANLYCLSCGYNARGVDSDRCPECGQDFSALAPATSRLPWLHRRHTGRYRAYCRSVLMLLFRPKLFCEQIDNPITLADARRFWLVTVLLAYLPLVGAVVQIYHSPAQRDSARYFIQLLFLPYWPVGLFVMFGLLLFIIFATGMPSYFCHPASLPITAQNRAIALSYLACAPLALMPLVIALWLIAEPLWQFEAIALAFRIAATVLAVWMLVAWHMRTAQIALTLAQRRRRALTILLILVAEMSLLVLCLVVIPAMLWYGRLVLRVLFQ